MTNMSDETFAFRMILKPGCAEEYRARHDAIWPDLAAALRDAGVSDYSIWLDPETNHLFAVLKRTPDHAIDHLPELEVVQRWWDHMADLMEVETGNAPVQVPLQRMFHLA